MHANSDHLTWEELERLLGISRANYPHYSTEALKETEKVIGRSLPPSYLHYAQYWGAGLVFGFFVIWTPEANPNLDIRVKSPQFKERMLDSIAMNFWKPSLHNLVSRLIPFGKSENGDILCWDPAQETALQEMPLYLLDSEQEDAVSVGGTLLSFLGDYCLGGKLNAVFPVGQGGNWNFDLTFERYS